MSERRGTDAVVVVSMVTILVTDFATNGFRPLIQAPFCLIAIVAGFMFFSEDVRELVENYRVVFYVILLIIAGVGILGLQKNL